MLWSPFTLRSAFKVCWEYVWNPSSSHSPTLPDRLVPDVLLASCNKLQEVHALLRSDKGPTRSIGDLLSSITSQKLRRIWISFVKYLGGLGNVRFLDEDEWDNEDEGETWNSFDTTSSHLFKQVSKIEGKLTLQLNFLFMTSGPVKFDQLLNQFSEYCESDISFTEVPFKCYVGPVPLSQIRSNPSTRLHLDSASEAP